jgi:hypothetical protein
MTSRHPNSHMLIHLDAEKHPTLARVTNAEGRNAGYVPLTVVADILLKAANEREGTEAADTSQWIDLLDSHHIAIHKLGDVTKYVIARPREAHTFRFERRDAHTRTSVTREYLIEIQPVVWLLEFYRRRLSHAYLYLAATQARSLLSANTFCSFDIGNVYDHGEVCWGTVSPATCDVNHPMGVVNLFWESTFNHDLSRGLEIEGSRGHYHHLEEWAARVSNGTAHEGGELVLPNITPLTVTGHTVAELLQRHNRRRST